ncbi:MAG TPA: hypothetical protein VGI39_35810 [Polyangiaceae bacterium]|jgi:hypothetical protein
MSPAPFVVALHKAPADVTARVRHACRRAGALFAPAESASGELAPSVLVAHLPRRERRIPASVLSLAERYGVNVPILLVCDEALVHPVTTLNLGGVTLVEHAAEERLYSQIRILAAAARADGDPREKAGPSWWMGSVTEAPLAVTDAGDALTILVPLQSTGDHAGLLAEAQRAIAGDDDVTSRLISTLGSSAGVVHLAGDARSWVIYWPAGIGGLRLFSSHRLPHVSDLSQPSDVPRILRGPAAPGEIVVASSRGFGAGDHGLLAGLSDGGPATLDRFRAGGAPLQGFVVEVR